LQAVVASRSATWNICAAARGPSDRSSGLPSSGDRTACRQPEAPRLADKSAQSLPRRANHLFGVAITTSTLPILVKVSGSVLREAQPGDDQRASRVVACSSLRMSWNGLAYGLGLVTAQVY